MQSDYMHWAKFHPPVRYPLTGSEVPHFRMDRCHGQSPSSTSMAPAIPATAPLREAIAARYDVSPEQVVAADGTSMANMLAMAALVAPGDEVLIEHPAYEPMLAAASFLDASIARFKRRPEDGFRLDPATLDAAITAATRLVVLTNLHNPSGVLAGDGELAAVGAIAGTRGRACWSTRSISTPPRLARGARSISVPSSSPPAA